MAPLRGVLRADGGVRARVTNIELFFDLIYVFAFTQLSEHLYEDLSWRGALETIVMLLALWWAWNQTAWATGLVDPERTPVATLLLVLMGISLITATAVPEAFDGRGLTFAVAYVALQLVRGSFMVAAFGRDSRMGRNYMHFLAWSGLAAVVWILGGVQHDEHLRLLIWAIAIAIDLAAPALGYWIPRHGSAPMGSWTLAGGHLAERCQLLLMVAFGETFLRIGEGFAEGHRNPGADIAFVVGFFLICSLWTMYYLRHAARGAAVLERGAERTAWLGRSGFTYALAILVAAVIMVADAIHITIDGPTAPASFGFAVICIGAPALYLVGIGLSRYWLEHPFVIRPLMGIPLLLIFGIPAAFVDRVLTLIVVALLSIGTSAMLHWGPAPDLATPDT